jgi:hypothetical protein
MFAFNVNLRHYMTADERLRKLFVGKKAYKEVTEAYGTGGTLPHFASQPEPLLSMTSLNLTRKKFSRQARKYTPPLSISISAAFVNEIAQLTPQKVVT